MAVNMQVNLGGLIMPNPVTDASGTFAAGHEYAAYCDVSRMGAVTTKGVSLNGWEGNDAPRIAETPSGMLNSIGLQNPGVAHLCEVDLPWIKSQGVPAIVNVSGHSLEEYVAVVEALEADGQADAYEINISCPNVDAGGLTFGTHVPSVEAVVGACRAAATKPMIVKLSPNVTDITEIARAAEASGADAISLINTLLGMAIDAKRRRPVLSTVTGGLSGPCVKPIALRMVWQVAKAVKIPVVGVGGIVSATDAVEVLLAGASAVQIGTANFIDPAVTIKVIDGLNQYLDDNGFKSVREIIGLI